MSLAYAELAGLLKSDLATIEIELAAAVRAVNRGDLAGARAAIATAQHCACAGQERKEPAVDLQHGTSHRRPR